MKQEYFEELKNLNLEIGHKCSDIARKYDEPFLDTVELLLSVMCRAAAETRRATADIRRFEKDLKLMLKIDDK